MTNILHADIDAFFASVEQLDNSELRGHPVIVGGGIEDRGVVATASYEARLSGVASAMPMKTALRLCPEAIRITPRFDRYQELSREVMSIFRDITPVIEPISLDEAFLDVSRLGDVLPQSIALDLKKKIKKSVGLTISVGMASSKGIAKIASDMGKPDGLIIVKKGDEQRFLAPLEVSKLWGVGPKTASTLAKYHIYTVGDLAKKPVDLLIDNFGKNGFAMHKMSLGQDYSPVGIVKNRKSVSTETTLSEDTADPSAVRDLVSRLSKEITVDLQQKNLLARTVKLKLRLNDFTTLTRQITFSESQDSVESISEATNILVERELEPGRQFRLVGVGLSGLQDKTVLEVPIQGRFDGF